MIFSVKICTDSSLSNSLCCLRLGQLCNKASDSSSRPLSLWHFSFRTQGLVRKHGAEKSQCLRKGGANLSCLSLCTPGRSEAVAECPPSSGSNSGSSKAQSRRRRGRTVGEETWQNTRRNFSPTCRIIRVRAARLNPAVFSSPCSGPVELILSSRKAGAALECRAVGLSAARRCSSPQGPRMTYATAGADQAPSR